ncbi:MAG: DUF222 domain-containing protein [Acidimicrobiaceae bacterium]|nr:DUF222 domain-containing protein [Acidimicrobiaceae bacterium]
MSRSGSGGAPEANCVVGTDANANANAAAAAAAAAEALTGGDTPDNGAISAAGPETLNRGGRPAAQPEMLGLQRLDHRELAALCRDELVDVLGSIERLANRLAGYRVDVMGALDELSSTGAAPDATPHLTLRDATGVTEREARRLRRIASKTREHAAVFDALSAGDINVVQAESLCDARVPDSVRADLVAYAAAHDTDSSRRHIREAETLHNVESATERFLRQRAERGAGWGRDHNGMLRLWARLDPETGAGVEAVLEPLRRALWQADKRIRTDRRAPAQRDADTLAYALAGITLTEDDAQVIDDLGARARQNGDVSPSRSGTGRTGPDHPHSKRTTPPPTLGSVGECEPGDELALSSNPQPGEPMRRLAPAQINVLIGLDALRGDTDQAGLTDAGTELAPDTVRRLACDSEIIPIILGGRGGPADIGRTRRTVPIRLRRLLIARDKHCVWPGCHAPPSRCDAHHLIHWADGGPTDLDNLALLCHTHHHHLHEHGYRLIRGPDRWTTARCTTTPPPRGSRRPSTTRRPGGSRSPTRQPRAP